MMDSVVRGAAIAPAPTFVQSVVDSMADIVDLPLAIVCCPALKDSFRSLTDSHEIFRNHFPTAREFRAFISQSHSNPEIVVRTITKNAKEWRPVFDDIYTDIFYVRPARVDPVIRLLRDHWSWKWAEILALYERLLSDPRIQAPNKFISSFGDETWLDSIYQIGLTPYFLVIGPVKKKIKSTNNIYRNLTSFIDRYLKINAECGFPPIHSPGRFEQFFQDRPPIFPNHLHASANAVVRALDFIFSIPWIRREGGEYIDVVAVTELAHFLSEFAQNLLSKIKAKDRQVLSIEYNFLAAEISRNLIFNLVLVKNAWKFIGAKLEKNMPKNQHHEPSILIRFANAIIPEIALDANRKFEEISRKRKTNRAERMLEELIFLRYRLADNFGILTAIDRLEHSFQSQRSQNNLAMRIARTAAFICNADSAVVYRYDYKANNLYCVGAYISGRPQAVDRPDFKWMEDIGKDLKTRNRSVAYAAFDEDRPTIYDGSSYPDRMVHSVSTFAGPPLDSAIPQGRSIIATPVRVFGRIWGVFEIVSNRKGSFSLSHIEILQKMSDMIGPYYHEQLMINTLHHIASPTDQSSAIPESEQFDKLARLIADIFLVEGACVWTRDLLIGNRFSCVGFVGRTDLDQLRQISKSLPSFDSRDSSSISSETIRQGKSWISGKIGELPFGSRWAEKAHVKSLITAKYRFIAITPVYDSEKKAILVISLYSKKTLFNPQWEVWAKFIGGYLSTVITRVYNVRELERRVTRLAAHEMSNSSLLVEQSASNLIKFIGNLPASVRRPENLHNWISDIQTHTKDIHKGLSVWAESSSTSEVLSVELIPLAAAEERSKTSPPQINFKIEFNRCVQPLRRMMRQRMLNITTNYPPDGLILKCHPEDLRIILNNLILNAIKYSERGTSIECGIVEQTYSVRFFMKNIGVPLSRGEELRLFDFGFRSGSARNAGSGSGLGLYIAKGVANLYGVTIRYDATSLGNDRSLAWHSFFVDFPRSMVINYD